jgi:hypothetical protein
MPMTRLQSLFLPFCVAILTSACATDAGKPDAEARIAERIDLMETTLLEHCRFDDVRSRAELAAVNELRARMSDMEARLVPPDSPAPSAECPIPPSVDAGEKLILGRAEWVGLPHLGSYFKARLDTGANTSSLSAEDITPFERDGENWVRFRLALTEDDVVVPEVRDREFEARIVRQVRIVQASGSDSRPVIRLPMTLGPLEQSVEFTLNDRSHLTYPILLGRRFMMDQVVIDVSQAYTLPRPEFPGGEPPDSAADDEAHEDTVED